MADGRLPSRRADPGGRLLGPGFGEAEEDFAEGARVGAREDGLEGGALFGGEGLEVEAVPEALGSGVEVEEGAGGAVVGDVGFDEGLADLGIGDGGEDLVEGVAVAADAVLEDAAEFGGAEAGADGQVVLGAAGRAGEVGGQGAREVVHGHRT